MARGVEALSRRSRNPSRRRGARRPSWKRIALVALLAASGGASLYFLVLRDTLVAPRVTLATATATIGEGEDAIPVGVRGELLPWLPVPEEARLPRLPLAEPPENGRLAGPVLAQARVLGAAPPALRPYIESSRYGEEGVAVVLRAGIELRFGDAGRRAQKWRAAAAVLANPATVEADYVNLHNPRRPAVRGSGYALPTIP